MSAVSIPTPQIGHLTSDDYVDVYEPAEDTFILLDALERDAQGIRDLNPALCVEIGSGSGIVGAFIGALLQPSQTDLNNLACRATLRTATANHVEINPVRGNLLQPLSTRFAECKVDLLVFNPPYVPTDDQELATTQGDKGIGGAWAGGRFGMAITNQVLDIIPSILSARGRFYLVAIEQNNPRQIMLSMRDLEGRCILQRKAGRELLSVLCFTRRT